MGVKIGIIVVALAIAGAMMYKSNSTAKDNVDHGEEVDIICKAPSCGKNFVISYRAYSQAVEKSNTGNVPCTHCGDKYTMIAQKCPGCGEVLAMGAHGSPPSECTKCDYQFQGQPGN